MVARATIQSSIGLPLKPNRDRLSLAEETGGRATMHMCLVQCLFARSARAHLCLGVLLDTWHGQLSASQ